MKVYKIIVVDFYKETNNDRKTEALIDRLIFDINK